MPLDRLLDKGYASELRASIDMTQKSESNPELFAQVYESEETTHFSVVDKDGNMVSLTYTGIWLWFRHHCCGWRIPTEQ